MLGCRRGRHYAGIDQNYHSAPSGGCACIGKPSAHVERGPAAVSYGAARGVTAIARAAEPDVVPTLNDLTRRVGAGCCAEIDDDETDGAARVRAPRTGAAPFYSHA